MRLYQSILQRRSQVRHDANFVQSSHKVQGGQVVDFTVHVWPPYQCSHYCKLSAKHNDIHKESWLLFVFLLLGHWGYILTQDSCIAEINDYIIDGGTTLEGCQEVCDTIKSFTCRSLDWNPVDGRCHLSKEWIATVPPSAVYSPCYAGPGWIIAERMFILTWKWGLLKTSLLQFF